MFLRHNLLSIFWTLIILILSFLPGKDLPEVGFFQFDKLVHVVFYLLLFAFTLIGWKRQTQFTLLKSISPYMIFIWCSLFGFLIECGQHFLTADRFFDWYDALANSIGAGIGLGLSHRLTVCFVNE